ncbi:adenine nucleotide alpha hydrolase [Halorussus halophilus]|uniref:adenine nucleotide alpha hydrolase n=1 Tax=Halorussus halophilus TaxID=2650975 RepID=UPI001300FDD2|nr:adenine nucleotide alpha hydrolase [Halorussus halophilus]
MVTDSTPTILSWSGGKDAAFALYEMRRGANGDAEEGDTEESDTDVLELLTTVSEATDRSSMHGVRRELYEQQADAVGLPLRVVELPADTSNDDYERVMADVMTDYERQGVEQVAFADLFLEDVRSYREQRLGDTEVEGYWPVWGRNTDEFAEQFLAAGFEATAVTVDGELLDESFAGRRFDADFLGDLPDDVDPCGEYGEFHTFVHDGPIFDRPVAVETGETVTREVGDGEFHYCDLLPSE